MSGNGRQRRAGASSCSGEAGFLRGELGFDDFEALVVGLEVGLHGMYGFGIVLDGCRMPFNNSFKGTDLIGIRLNGFGLATKSLGMSLDGCLQNRDILFDRVKIRLDTSDAVPKIGLHLAKSIELREHLLHKHIRTAGFVLGRERRFLGWFLGRFHGSDLTAAALRLSSARSAMGDPLPLAQQAERKDGCGPGAWLQIFDIIHRGKNVKPGTCGNGFDDIAGSADESEPAAGFAVLAVGDEIEIKAGRGFFAAVGRQVPAGGAGGRA